MDKRRRVGIALRTGLTAVLAGLLAGCGGEKEEGSEDVPTDRPSSRSEAGLPSGQPVAPTVNVRVAGDEIVVEYAFERPPDDPRLEPWMLLIAVEPPRDDLPPRVTQHMVESERGEVRAPVGLARPPYVVRIVAETEMGIRSKIITRRTG